MALEAIFKAIEKNFAKECENTLDRAKKEAAKIAFEARQKIEKLNEEERLRSERKIHIALMQFRMETEFEKKKKNGLAKIDSIQKVVDTAKDEVEKIVTRPEYDEIFSVLAGEVLPALSGHLDVYIHPRDSGLAEKALTKNNLTDYKLFDDESCLGGLRVIAEKGKITYDNTLKSRFEKASVVLRPMVIEALFNA